MESGITIRQKEKTLQECKIKQGNTAGTVRNTGMCMNREEVFLSMMA